jgi:ribosomal protein S15
VFARKHTKKQGFRDSYAIQHGKQRKAANESRQSILRQLRAKDRGDPVRGITTPFVESFDTAIPPSIADSSHDAHQSITALDPPSPRAQVTVERLNHFISEPELERSLEFSRRLTEPIPSNQDTSDPQQEFSDIQKHQDLHLKASEVLRRILNVDNVSSKHRTRINTQRIIDTFGRHITDQYMKPKAPAPLPPSTSGPRPTATPRAGPDVGSSEVQIGILTAKIRVLADRYANENRNDKVNKRNLRVLLHRRQKLLKYMHKKERGSPRWYHMIEKLGLTEATWRGEIELR